ncbi:Ni/Fe hydrogenase [Hydrogenobacter hydrogenophilus]|uniref:Hydrogenase small subunit n=1 Tax=Hydrogenobacter hydrogenophilus TaxID=35835 RepID=A0A285P1W1_9AQUI|nr:Ni/Fe hydrogenase [Hydrogenobacter hydrogenophilus]SNZ15724.1 hydrogenase small subunit [Hydrogenobacter hydrogenophilus]
MNVLWLQRLSCCGNTHSLLNCDTFNSLLKEVNFLFHPSLSIENEEEIINKVLEGSLKLDLFILEGAVRINDEKVKELCYTANYVMAVGSCAVYGNIPALKDNYVCGLQYRFKEKGGLLGEDFVSKGGLPVINLSGCPAHPEWIVGVIRSLARGIKPALDSWGRPKEFYSSLTHWGCTRNEYFEWKIEPESLGSKKGCLFYNYGCRGPMTYSSCNTILWNGVNSKTRAGTPCFGCTEFDFPRVGLFETKQFAGLPAELPIGVSKRGYIMLSGIAKMFAPERLKVED